ncbi:hypothetical protein [Phosphitispora fastidiosa]|uniref:hypothetical protein n=1 Tax=Phosphitispora fastidiosa TaxID=2837202 RepID=UPI001E4D455E|nr:hypothetical protein [Phosphitispora fastidiosa]MBU7006587.1 hypothetical protein [Phosphitispora fastidiosa]
MLNDNYIAAYVPITNFIWLTNLKENDMKSANYFTPYWLPDLDKINYSDIIRLGQSDWDFAEGTLYEAKRCTVKEALEEYGLQNGLKKQESSPQNDLNAYLLKEFLDMLTKTFPNIVFKEDTLIGCLILNEFTIFEEPITNKKRKLNKGIVYSSRCK